MPPLWLSIAIAVLGLGWPLNLLVRRLFPSLQRRYARAISAVTVLILITGAQEIVEYPTWARELRSWQREALALNCPSVPSVLGKITYYVGTAPRQLEAEDYSRKLMDVFNGCHLSAAYGYDPFPNYIIVNDKKVIVSPDENLLLRVQGIELWVLDPKHPPVAAKQMADALTSAGISFDWKPDIRLAGIAAYDRYRIPVESPQCILFVGSKPPWSWRSLLWTERKFFAFRSQHPPDANDVMYRALVAYGLLIFSAPLAVVLLWVAERCTVKQLL
jgi:hypothetical protein